MKKLQLISIILFAISFGTYLVWRFVSTTRLVYACSGHCDVSDYIYERIQFGAPQPHQKQRTKRRQKIGTN